MACRIEYIPEQVVLGTAPSNPATGYGKTYPKSNGKLGYLDSTGGEFDVYLGKTLALPGAFVNSTVTRNIVSNGGVTWSFAVVSGRRYKIEILAGFQTVAPGTGGTMSVNLSGGGVGTVIGFMNADISQATVATTLRAPIRAIGTEGLAGSLMTSSGVGLANSPHIWNSSLIFSCVTSGTFEVRWASEVAASATQLNAGSVLSYFVI
jgi:hypothetical protein